MKQMPQGNNENKKRVYGYGVIERQSFEVNKAVEG
jgi:hypothetical protein